MDVDIPVPNQALSALMLSERMRGIVAEVANNAQFLYQSEVAKRTGLLAASAHSGTEVGGKRHDRWIGELQVGGLGPLGTVEYAASHEFGTSSQKAAHDLNRVLEQLGQL